MRAVYSSILVVGLLLHGHHFGLAVVLQPGQPSYNPVSGNGNPEVFAGVLMDLLGPASARSVAKLSTLSREDVQKRREFLHRRAKPQLDKIWEAYEALAQEPLANYQLALDEGRGLDKTMVRKKLQNVPRGVGRHMSSDYFSEFADDFSTDRARAFLLHWAEEGSRYARGTGSAELKRELGGFFFDTDLLLQMGEDRDAGIIRLREGTTVRILGLGDAIREEPWVDKRWGQLSHVNPVAQGLIDGSFANKPDKFRVGEGRMITTYDETGDEGIGKVVCMFHQMRKGVFEQTYVVDVPYRRLGYPTASQRERVLLPTKSFQIDVPAPFLRFLAPVAVHRTEEGPGRGRGARHRGRGARHGGSVSWDVTRLPIEVAGGGWAVEAKEEERRCKKKLREYEGSRPGSRRRRRRRRRRSRRSRRRKRSR